LARVAKNNQDIKTSKKHILVALSLESDFEEAIKFKKRVSP
jgi:phosphohistidine swiveling domain-containing protein